MPPPNALQDMINRLAKLETFTGFDDSEGGLRRDINELRVAFKSLERTVAGINNRIYFAMGGMTVIGAFLEWFFQSPK